MNLKSLLIMIFLESFLMGHMAMAVTPEFNSTKTIAEKQLTLNGVGIRKATWLKVKVYHGGLYLLEKSDNPEQVLSMPFPKAIDMKFVRSVDAEKLRNAWTEALKRATSNDNPYPSQLNQFNQLMEDVDTGDILALTFLEEGVKLQLNQKPVTLVAGKDFAQALFSVWFINPEDEGLRDGLLGQSVQ